MLHPVRGQPVSGGKRGDLSLGPVGAEWWAHGALDRPVEHRHHLHIAEPKAVSHGRQIAEHGGGHGGSSGVVFPGP